MNTNILNYKNKEYLLSTEQFNDTVYETVVHLIEDGYINENVIYSFRTIGNDAAYNEKVVIEYLASRNENCDNVI